MRMVLAGVAVSIGLVAGSMANGGSVSTAAAPAAAPAAAGPSVPARPAGESSKARVLVIGDSTAAGIGAPPSASVAARIAQAFPAVRVDNLGVNGARLDDTLQQLARDGGPRPQLLVIMAGGNDVIRLASASRLERELDSLLAAAAASSEHTVLISPGNLAAAPALWWPFDSILGSRSRMARDLFDRVAQRHRVKHVSMFRELDEDPFALLPERYFSSDGIHPSAEGYRLWYDKLAAQVPLPALLAD